MGQLHDRNCRRSFAPAEAFQADALPADRFVAEVAAAAAAGTALADGASAGGGAEGAPGGGGRAWGLLSYAPFLVPFRWVGGWVGGKHRKAVPLHDAHVCGTPASSTLHRMAARLARQDTAVTLPAR